MTFKFDDRGLIVAVAQDHLTGQVRMVAWMNREAINLTLETGKATFFSRSRSTLWTKGETSGHTLMVRSVFLDCDGDTLLLQVEPVGPSCHTGRPACFFRRLHPDGAITEAELGAGAFLERLEVTLQSRKAATSQKSYTKALLEAGSAKIGAKIVEEAGELCAALQHESQERVTSEAADVMYHLMVGLLDRGVTWREVLQRLEARLGVSGHDEKASRKPDQSPGS